MSKDTTKQEYYFLWKASDNRVLKLIEMVKADRNEIKELKRVAKALRENQKFPYMESVD